MDKFQELNSLVEKLHDIGGKLVFSALPSVVSTETALLLIDIQNSICKDYFEHTLESLGFDVSPYQEVFELLDQHIQTTVHNIAELLTVCRQQKVTPIHVKVESLLLDARDTGSLHAMAHMFEPPGSPSAMFLGETAPIEDEIVLTKTCSGAHVGTNLDRVLRNLGIKTVIVVGFYTDQCVSTTVRDLADLGYKVIIPEEGVNAASPERHCNAMQSLRHIYAFTETMDSLIKRLREENDIAATKGSLL